MKETLIFF